MPTSCCEDFFTPRGRKRSDGWSSASSCHTLHDANPSLAMSHPDPKIRPASDKSYLEIKGLVASLIMWRPSSFLTVYRWIAENLLILRSKCTYVVCASCTVSSCAVQMSDTRTICFVPINPKLRSLVQDAGKSGLEPLGPRVSTSLTSSYCYCTKLLLNPVHM